MPHFRIPLTSRRTQLAEGWQRLERAGRDGPLDDHTCHLIDLALAMATTTAAPRTLRTHIDHARTLGITDAEIDQLIALTAPTIGKPATLAAYEAADVDVPVAPPPDMPPSSSDA